MTNIKIYKVGLKICKYLLNNQNISSVNIPSLLFNSETVGSVVDVYPETCFRHVYIYIYNRDNFHDD